MFLSVKINWHAVIKKQSTYKLSIKKMYSFTEPIFVKSFLNKDKCKINNIFIGFPIYCYQTAAILNGSCLINVCRLISLAIGPAVSIHVVFFITYSWCFGYHSFQFLSCCAGVYTISFSHICWTNPRGNYTVIFTCRLQIIPRICNKLTDVHCMKTVINYCLYCCRLSMQCR